MALVPGSFRPVFDVYAETRRVPVGDVSIAVADHGPADGVPVLAIHGFPDSARLWRHQIPVLADAGYRVLAPDLRGFGRSDRPEEVDAYRLAAVAGDMIGLLDDAGLDDVHVVGHDWGGAVAWFLAIAHPGRVRSLTALSVGHPAAFQAAGLRQLEKSWYMLLFQFEGIAEEWLSRDDWRGLREWAGSAPELEHWIADLSRSGALTAALNLYRANMGPERLLAPPLDLPDVRVPMLGVWSSGDPVLTEEQMTDSEPHVADEWRYVRLDGIGHWIPVEAPDRLNRLLTDWFAEH